MNTLTKFEIDLYAASTQTTYLNQFFAIKNVSYKLKNLKRKIHTISRRYDVNIAELLNLKLELEKHPNANASMLAKIRHALSEWERELDEMAAYYEAEQRKNEEA